MKNFGLIEHGIILIKCLYIDNIFPVDRASATPFPLIWIASDTLEFSDIADRRVRWRVSESSPPNKIGAGLHSPVSLEAPASRAVVSMVSPQGTWALVLEPPEDSSEFAYPEQYLYQMVNHQYQRLGRPRGSRLHATLLPFQNSTYLVTVHDSGSLGGVSRYHVRCLRTLVRP